MNQDLTLRKLGRIFLTISSNEDCVLYPLLIITSLKIYTTTCSIYGIVNFGNMRFLKWIYFCAVLFGANGILAKNNIESMDDLYSYVGAIRTEMLSLKRNFSKIIVCKY